jgi:DNA repair exonuclease SbcCD nuclease subunit
MRKPNQSTSSAQAVLLAIGDIHLGTRCSGLPDELSSWGIEPRQLTPATALYAAVDLAIQMHVDAVLFAGDVVESTNARFEAIVPLEKSIRRLLKERIQVIAVAGNHDVEALPRLAQLIDGFTLLGVGGQWESCIIERDGQALAEIVGWSFGERVVRQSPIAQLLAEPLDQVPSKLPRVGLVHADLDASGGPYAPIKRTELDQSGFDAWLLGHIHKPSTSTLSGTSSHFPYGYLGSLVGLDPTETGPHGPWLITVDGPGHVRAEQQPIAPLRWEQLTLIINDTDDVEDVPDRLLGEAEARVRQLADIGEAPRALGLRVRVEGASQHYEPIRKAIANGDWNALGRVVGETSVFINKVTDGLRSPIDLTEIALGDDPPALLARRILSLQRNDQSATALFELARSGLADFVAESQWSPLQDRRDPGDPLSDESLRDLMLRAGTSALHAMLEQQAGNEEP